VSPQSQTESIAARSPVIDVPFWCRQTADGPDIPSERLTLSPEESARASRFLRAEDRRDYSIAHSLLRDALSQYRPTYLPAAWQFEINPFGKPSIHKSQRSGGTMEFSLSHTRGFVACAIAPVRIGIDVERLDREIEVLDIVTQHFSASEAAALHRLPSIEHRDRFFQLWTLKEAFFKALGCGISDRLDTAIFDLENPGAIKFQAPHGICTSDWQFALFLPTPTIRMAIAIESAQTVRWNDASVKATWPVSPGLQAEF